MHTWVVYFVEQFDGASRDHATEVQNKARRQCFHCEERVLLQSSAHQHEMINRPRSLTLSSIPVKLFHYLHTRTRTHTRIRTRTHTHTHTHPFNGPLSWTTQVSRYQKGKTNLDFTEARDSEWHWHQLGHMQVCTSLPTDNHASIPPLSFLQAGCPSCCPTNSVKALQWILK